MAIACDDLSCVWSVPDVRMEWTPMAGDVPLVDFGGSPWDGLTTGSQAEFVEGTAAARIQQKGTNVQDVSDALPRKASTRENDGIDVAVEGYIIEASGDGSGDLEKTDEDDGSGEEDFDDLIQTHISSSSISRRKVKSSRFAGNSRGLDYSSESGFKNTQGYWTGTNSAVGITKQNPRKLSKKSSAKQHPVTQEIMDGMNIKQATLEVRRLRLQVDQLTATLRVKENSVDDAIDQIQKQYEQKFQTLKKGGGSQPNSGKDDALFHSLFDDNDTAIDDMFDMFNKNTGNGAWQTWLDGGIGQSGKGGGSNIFDVFGPSDDEDSDEYDLFGESSSDDGDNSGFERESDNDSDDGRKQAKPAESAKEGADSQSDGETEDERRERKRKRELERLKLEAEAAQRKKIELEKKAKQEAVGAAAKNLGHTVLPKPNSSVGNVPPPPPPPQAGVPPPPPLGLLLQKKPDVKPNVPMRKLYWAKLREVKGTIWEGIGDDESDIDIQDFESMFGLAPALAAKKEKKKDTEAAPKRKTLIDKKRAFNMDITLARFRMSFDKIKDAVVSMDESLNEGHLTALATFAPTEKELELVLGSAHPFEMLGNAEQYILTVAPISRLGDRLELMLFRKQYKELLGTVKSDLEVVQKAARVCKTSSSLPKLLQTILRFGNYMNGGTSNGQASGFSLETLAKVTNTKSSGGNMTLLSYIVGYVQKNEPELSSVVLELLPCKAASRVEMNVTTKRVSAIQKQIKRLEVELAIFKDSSAKKSDRFYEVMSTFWTSAVKDANDLERLLESTAQDVTNLQIFFGVPMGKQTPWEKTFHIFNCFASDYAQAEKKLERVRINEEKLRLRKEAAAKRIGVRKRGQERVRPLDVQDILKSSLISRRALISSPQEETTRNDHGSPSQEETFGIAEDNESLVKQGDKSSSDEDLFDFGQSEQDVDAILKNLNSDDE